MPVVSLNRDSIKSSLSRLTAPRSPGRQRSNTNKSKAATATAVVDDEHPAPPPPPPPSPSIQGGNTNTTTPLRVVHDKSIDNDNDDIFPYTDEQPLPPIMPRPPSSSSSRAVVSREQQHRGGDPPSSTFGNSNAAFSSSNSNSTEAKLVAIQKVYGPNTNIYRDVLKVSPDATPAEIREAFFCLRYDLYQKHENDDQGNGGGGSGGGALTSDERRNVEEKMDAIAGAFHILGDVNRRRAYDASLETGFEGGGGARRNEMTDEMGFPIASSSNINNRGSPASAATLPTTTSPSPKSNVVSSASTSSRNLPPTRQLSPRQRRTINNYRRDAGVAGGAVLPTTTTSGMNESRRVVARPVTGGLNARPSLAANSTVKDEDVIGGGGKKTIGGRESPRWADFDSTLDQKMNTPPNHASSRSSPNEEEEEEDGVEEDGRDEVPIMAGVNNLNAREKLLYKSQLKHSQQQQQQSRTGSGSANTASSSSSSSRLANRYNFSAARDRGDRYAEEDPMDANNSKNKTKKSQQLASPTGVDADLDRDSSSVWSKKLGGRRGAADSGTGMVDSTKEEDEYQVTATTTRTATATTTKPGSNNIDNYDDDGGGEEESTYASSYDEDTRTYDDDTQTYDDDTQTYDDNTTIGGSTWASADTSYVPPDDDDDPPRHSPGHKKGNIPEPILKSCLNRGEKRVGQDSDNTKRRVTIHSHCGRGEDEEDFSLFEGAMCPSLLSLGAIKEEVNGTYNDFTQALHQVSNAFVINPDDIDRLADKIRDAKIELGENYARQVNERRVVLVVVDQVRGRKCQRREVEMARKRRPRSLPREQRIMLSSECHTFRVSVGDGAEMEGRAQYLS